MAGGTAHNRGKLKELMVLMAARSEGDPRMSRVKWNKLLYRADFECFRLQGQSMTGTTYVRGEYGPMVKDLPIYEDELGAAGRLSWRTETSGKYSRKVPVAIGDPADTRQFTAQELAIIDETLDELRDYGGKQASDWSHAESLGWRLADMGKAIEYEFDLVASGPAPDTAVARLRDRVISGNWEQ